MGMEFKEYVLKWCKDEGMFKEEIKEAGTEFHYRISLPELPDKIPLLLSVVQPERKDKVIITVAVGLGPEYTGALAKMEKQEREKFMMELCYMMQLGPAYFSIEESDGILKQVSVSDVIYTDGLSKDRFMRSVQAVYKGVSLAILQLRGILGNMAQSQPKEEPRKTLGGSPQKR
jgi:hypothetical protein